MAPFEFTEEELRHVRQQAEDSYRALDRIRCPYFAGDVHFNTDGFRHLLFKWWNRSRDQRDQFLRLKHFDRAPEILRLSRTLQGKEETHEWERRPASWTVGESHDAGNVL